jgi:hypothetical protein
MIEEGQMAEIASGFGEEERMIDVEKVWQTDISSWNSISG